MASMWSANTSSAPAPFFFFFTPTSVKLIHCALILINYKTLIYSMRPQKPFSGHYPNTLNASQAPSVTHCSSVLMSSYSQEGMPQHQPTR